MRDTAENVRTNSSVTFSYGPLCTDVLVLDDQQELIYNMLCTDTECCQEDLPESIDYRVEWPQRVREIPASTMTWWWWWWCHINILVYIEFLWKIFRNYSIKKCTFYVFPPTFRNDSTCKWWQNSPQRRSFFAIKRIPNHNLNL